MTVISHDSGLTQGSITQPPSGFDRFINTGTKLLAWFFAIGTIALLAYIIYEIGLSAIPAIKEHARA